MDSVLSSLSALMLRALPTFFILLFIHFYLKVMFFKPLDKALAERKSATAGVRKLAEESFRKAEQKAAEYEAAVRAARAQLYKEQEEKRNAWRQQQASALTSMREKTGAMVRDARATLDVEKEAAKASLQAESEALAEQIAGAVLAGGSR
jgi:F-type H+-transporting ATPase subunit b